MSDEELLRRLDKLIAIMLLANRDAIEAAKAAVREDPSNAAILDETTVGWVRSGELQRRVSERTGISTRTIRGRLQELVSQQVIEQGGSGTTTEYRSTGLL